MKQRNALGGGRERVSENFFLREVKRQFLHALGGMCIIFAGIFFGFFHAKMLALISLFFALLFSFLMMRGKRFWFIDFFLNQAERKSEKIPLQAPILFLTGANVSLLLFSPQVALSALIVLAFGDAASTVFGKRFGNFFVGSRSIEGTAGGIIVAFIALLVYTQNPVVALIGSFAGMFAELLLPWEDGLTIPIAVGIALTLFG
jgi:dolichol kinase